MDALAFYRRARGLPALSINWGAWSTIGAASESKVGARIATQGVRFITPSQGLAILDMLIRQGQAQIGVLPMDWTVFRRRFHAGSVAAWLSEIVPQEPQPTRAAPVPASDVRTLLAEAQPAHRPRLLLDFVSAQAVRVLGTGVGQDIDERQPLRDLGLDSLMAIELRNLLDTGLGLARPLPATLVFDYPTVEALARYLAKEILDQSEAEPEREEETARPVDGGGRIADMLASLEDLSDEDVDRLLLDQRQRSP
jgi:acyl carrier protein